MQSPSDVGDALGDIVGDQLYSSVLDGLSEGDLDGETLGHNDGDTLGENDGMDGLGVLVEGLIVGNNVGCIVGVVGASMLSQQLK